MSFDEAFARGVRKIARDYAKGLRSGTTGTGVDPDMVELEIETGISDIESEEEDLDQESPPEEELVA